jgi:hypothetical protein
MPRIRTTFGEDSCETKKSAQILGRLESMGAAAVQRPKGGHGHSLSVSMTDDELAAAPTDMGDAHLGAVCPRCLEGRRVAGSE